MRSRIDPEQRYGRDGEDGLTLVESHALDLIWDLPINWMQRTRDCFELHVRTPQNRFIVIILTPEAIELRFPTIEWTKGKRRHAPTSRLWKRMRWTEEVSTFRILNVVITAMRKREEMFKPCRYCGASFPPELRRRNVCHRCAERHGQHVH